MLSSNLDGKQISKSHFFDDLVSMPVCRSLASFLAFRSLSFRFLIDFASRDISLLRLRCFFLGSAFASTSVLLA